MLSNFEEVLCFAAVCKTGSITQAANLLNCSKANVSRKVTAFEKRLGTKLLQRTTRQIFLTEAGSRFKQQAIQLYDDSRQLDNRTRADDQALSGRFRITAPVSLSSLIVAPLLFKLQKQFPLINFEFIPTNENVKLIESEIDLAIRTGSVVDDTLVAKKLGEFHEGFFTSSKNLPEYATLSLKDVTRMPVILNPCNINQNKVNVFDGNKAISIEFPSNLKVSEFQISFNMLFDSKSIVWLPNYCEGASREGDTVTRILPSISGQPWPVYLVFPFQTPIPLKLKSIMEYLEFELKNVFE